MDLTFLPTETATWANMPTESQKDLDSTNG